MATDVAAKEITRTHTIKIIIAGFPIFIEALALSNTLFLKATKEKINIRTHVTHNCGHNLFKFNSCFDYFLWDQALFWENSIRMHFKLYPRHK